MQEVTVKNEFDKSYLVIEEENTDYKAYDYKMMTQNQIKGFIGCKQRYEEDRACLYYDITSKKTLEKEFENKEMSFTQIYELFFQMNQLLKRGNDYLLNPKFIMFHPSYIYFDLETGELYGLYIPFEISLLQKTADNTAERRFHALADFFLDKINHKDEHAVNAAYQFYKMSKEAFFSFEAFLSFLDRERGIEEEEESKVLNSLKTEGQMMQPKSQMEEYTFSDEYVQENHTKEAYLEKKRVRNKIALFILLLLVAVVFLTMGYVVPALGIYRWYFTAASLLIFTIWIILLGKYAASYITKLREKQYETEPSEVSVEEYFGQSDSEETIFFDSAGKEENEIIFQWSENGIPREYHAMQYPFLIGKKRDAVDMYIEESSVSRLHAKIDKEGEQLFIQDMYSTNGCFVNEERIKGDVKTQITLQDRLRIGKVEIRMT